MPIAFIALVVFIQQIHLYQTLFFAARHVYKDCSDVCTDVFL